MTTHPGTAQPDEGGTVPGLVARHARERPDAPALIQGTRVVTWSDLAARAFPMANWLRDHGVSPHDRVTIQCGDVPTLDEMVAMVGIASACACHPMMADQPLAARRRLIERITPAFVMSGKAIDAAEYPVPVLLHRGGALAGSGSRSRPESDSGRPPAASDIAMIVGTSGTTAEPKMVQITHRTLTEAGRMCSRMTGLDSGDRLLVMAAPYFGLFGIAFVPFWMGGAVVLPEDAAGNAFATGPGAIQPTWAAAAPGKLALLAETLQYPAGGESPFRFVLSAGAPATEANAEAIARGFRAPRVDLYGASESYSMAYDGRIAAPLRIAALDGDGVAEAPAGEPGEVQASGDMVFPGYLDDPDLTAAAFTSDGWYRTGDLGRIGEDGRLELLGRLSETINRGGLKIAPAEIEAAVLGCPGVAEAVAFGVPNEVHGELPALAVVPAAGSALTAREVRRHLLGRLPAAKTPSHVVLLDALPVTDAGKVSRRELAALLAPAAPPAGAS